MRHYARDGETVCGAKLRRTENPALVTCRTCLGWMERQRIPGRHPDRPAGCDGWEVLRRSSLPE